MLTTSLEYQPIFTFCARFGKRVARLIDILALPRRVAGSLDVPCGQGRHAHLLAEAGYRVDGLDYSRHLIDLAKQRGTSRTLKYTRGEHAPVGRRPGTGRFRCGW